MRRQNIYLLSTASGMAVAAAAGGAQAADMPLKAPALTPAPLSWAGWYVGLNAGVAWERMNADPVSPYAVPVLAGGAPTSLNNASFIGGGQIGYNWQSGIYVYGLEADFSGLAGSHSNFLPATVAFDGAGVSSRISWLSTVRARAGVTLNNDSLVYLTGGVAFGEVNNAFNFGDTGAPAFVNNKSLSKTRVGWTVGGGFEHMMTSHWTVGLEGLWVDLGKSTVTINPGGTVKTTTFNNRIAIGRLKLNYKF